MTVRGGGFTSDEHRLCCSFLVSKSGVSRPVPAGELANVACISPVRRFRVTRAGYVVVFLAYSSSDTSSLNDFGASPDNVVLDSPSDPTW